MNKGKPNTKCSSPWADKYKPKRLDDLVGNDETITQIKNLLNKKEEIPDLFFYGSPGVGKSVTADCIANELFGESKKVSLIEFNAADLTKEDVRKYIEKAAMAIPAFSDIPFKMCIIDECEKMKSEHDTLLRTIMDKYKKNIRFILICNDINHKNVSEPIKSRCLLLELKPLSKGDIVERLKWIANAESLQFSDKDCQDIACRAKGDMRKAIILLQGEAAKIKTSSGLTLEDLIEKPDKSDMIEAKVEHIDPKLLKTDPNQPRRYFDDEYIKELARTFDTHSIIEPIEVDENNMIIRGAQRKMAAESKGLGKVPIIRKIGLSPVERLERQIIDDTFHKDLSPIEKAWAYATAICNINDPEHTPPYTIPEVMKMENQKLTNLLTLRKGVSAKGGASDLSRRIGVPQTTISTHLQLLKLPTETQKQIEEKKIPYTKAIIKPTMTIPLTLVPTPAPVSTVPIKPTTEPELSLNDIINHFEETKPEPAMLGKSDYEEYKKIAGKITEMKTDWIKSLAHNEKEELERSLIAIGEWIRKMLLELRGERNPKDTLT